MIKILYAGKTTEYSAYKNQITSGLNNLNIDHEISDTAASPEEVDYIIYAPNSALSDFTPFTNVKLVQNLWAGVETAVTNETLTQPFARMVEPGLNQGMAEYVLGHVLRYHLETDFFAAQKPGVWRDDVVPPLAADRTVGIMGLGALGLDCALRLSELGFDVHGWSRTEKHIENVTCHFGADGLANVLGQAEILVLLLPDTPATRNIINAKTISHMRTDVRIINPGRGTLMDDDDLLAALDSEQVAAATLDVFSAEPLPKEHPYWTHPKVLVTPHVASSTRIKTAAQTVVENIRRGEVGESFLHLVDRELGY